MFFQVSPLGLGRGWIKNHRQHHFKVTEEPGWSQGLCSLRKRTRDKMSHMQGLHMSISSYCLLNVYFVQVSDTPTVTG